MSASTEALTAILYQALGEPIGLLLRTSDTERARQGLYRARAASGDPDLARLQFRVSPITEGDLVIVKGVAPKAQEPSQAAELGL
jgi:hypothetical protein